MRYRYCNDHGVLTDLSHTVESQRLFAIEQQQYNALQQHKRNRQHFEERTAHLRLILINANVDMERFDRGSLGSGAQLSLI